MAKLFIREEVHCQVKAVQAIILYRVLKSKGSLEVSRSNLTKAVADPGFPKMGPQPTTLGSFTIGAHP